MAMISLLNKSDQLCSKKLHLEEEQFTLASTGGEWNFINQCDVPSI